MHWILILTLLVGFVHQARAVAGIGIFFDPEGTVEETTVPGFTIFSCYIIARDLEGIDAVELRIQLSNPRWHIIERIVHQVGATDQELEENDEWLVQLGQCTVAPQLLLLEYRIGYFEAPLAPNDLIVCLAPRTVPVSDALTPGYRECGGEWRTFALLNAPRLSLPNGCIIVNPSGPECASQRVIFAPLSVIGAPESVVDLPVQWAIESYLPKSAASCIYYSMQSFSMRVRWDPALASVVDVVHSWDVAELDLSWSGSDGDVLVQGVPLQYPNWSPNWSYPVLFMIRLRLTSQLGSTPVTLTEVTAPGTESGISEIVVGAGAITVSNTVAAQPLSLGAVKARY